MSKQKVKQSKVKKPSSKYSKLLAVAAKELAAKKKALVSAERNLAKAKQKNEELVIEVARLDMVERSLKALVEGTEPPTNVRYIYQYPQWVWYQQPYVTYTIPQYQQPGYYLNGQWQTQPQGITYTTCQNVDMSGVQNFQTSGNISVSNTIPSVMTTTAGSLLNANVESVLTNAGTSTLTANCSTPVNLNNVSLTNGSGVPRWENVTNNSHDDGFVIDLTTHAEQEEAPEPVEMEAAKA
jgi:hypothetical protein